MHLLHCAQTAHKAQAWSKCEHLAAADMFACVGQLLHASVGTSPAALAEQLKPCCSSCTTLCERAKQRFRDSLTVAL
jgi:hypothetical protein